MLQQICRAKRKDNNEWEYGYYCRYGWTGQEKDYIVPYYASALYPIEIDVDTLCRSFEYKDGKDKIIFDKDIVQLTTECGRVGKYLVEWISERQEYHILQILEDSEFIGDVKYYFRDLKHDKFDIGTFCLMLTDPYGDFRPEYGGSILVIGNAYDNPEILNARSFL